jgi:hypothetical protein
MFDETEFITGEEWYPIVGNAITYDQAAYIWGKLKGLKKHWDCIDKANKVREILGGKVAMGSLLIWDMTMTSNYGFFFNPPLEIHAWNIMDDGSYVDFALPGVIENALKSKDDEGPLVTGRKPFILAGQPLVWTDYKTYVIQDIRNGLIIGTVSSAGITPKNLSAAHYLFGKELFGGK